MPIFVKPRRLFLFLVLVALPATVSFSQAATYSIEDVAPSTVSSSSFSYFPKKINDSGVITGFKYYLDSGSVVAQTWTGQFELPAGGSNSYGYAISNSGIVAGRGTFSNFDNRAYLYSPQSQSFSWLPCPLYSPYGRLCEAYAINESGVAVGTSDPRFLYPADNGTSSRALKWDSGAVSEIFPAASFASIAHDINASGTIAGMREYQPFLLSPTTGLQLLGSFGNNGSIGEMVVATALNDSNHAVGLHTLNSEGLAQRSFFWNGTTAIDIGTLGVLAIPYGGPAVEANDVNNNDQVVGRAAVGFDGNDQLITHAFIWDPQNGIRDLNNLIPSDSGIILTHATGINNSGEIAAIGYRTGDNPYIQRAYRLKTPIQTRNPIIFIPGTMGSNIRGSWNGLDVQFWVNLNPVTLFPSVPSVKNLTLDGTSSFYIEGLYASDVLRSVATVGFYRDFINHLGQAYKPYDINRHFGQQLGCDFQNQYNSDPAENPSLFVFPYDWRHDNNQSADKLQEYIQCVKQFYPPGTDIDLVAHSQGGLIARRYILQSQIRNEPHNIGKVLTIASPFLGAPEATYKLYTGGGFDALSVAASPSNIKFLAPSFPSMHQLLPSRTYQDLEGIVVAESGDVNANGIPDEIYSFNQNISQLNADFPNTSPGTVGAGFHDLTGQDDWRLDQSGIDYFHIVGEQSQLNTTNALVVKYSLQCKLTGIGVGLGGRCYNDRLYIPSKGFGDKTVPTISALRSKTLPNGETVNLAAPSSTTYYYQSFDASIDGNAEHVKLLDNTKIRQLVAFVLGFGPKPPIDDSGESSLVQNSVQVSKSWKSKKSNSGLEAKSLETIPTSTNLNEVNDRITEVTGNQSVPSRDLSSVNPSFYVMLTGQTNASVEDEQGNRAFVDSETLLLNNSVPGLIGYEMIGDDSTMLTLSASQTYTLEFASVERSIGIDLVQGKGNKTPTSAIRWNDLNIPPGLTVRLTVSDSTLAKVEFDSDGNGQFDTLVAPTVRIDGISATDINPPVPNIQIVQNGSQAIAEITAQDGQTGVNRVFYSTDGLNFQVYNSPIIFQYSTVPFTIYTFADDNAANRSGVYTRTFTFAPVNESAVSAIVRHGFTLNGTIQGSVHQILGENTVLNSSAILTGDLLVPGVPNLVRNGNSTFGGVTSGVGSSQPTNFSVTLNSSSQLGRLLTRTDAVPMPTVAPPPIPSGTRNVTINNASQSIGDFGTLRNLTLNSNAGLRAIPPGTYGNFTANSGSGFTLGIVGSSSPSAYNLQSLVLNSNSQLQIVGPVILTLPSGVTLNASAGVENSPGWLNLRIASGGLILNSSRNFYGNVLAPNGTITINGKLVGSIVSDRLVINSSGRLEGF